MSLSFYSIPLSIQSRFSLPLFPKKKEKEKKNRFKVESSPTSLRFVLGEGFVTRSVT